MHCEQNNSIVTKEPVTLAGEMIRVRVVISIVTADNILGGIGCTSGRDKVLSKSPESNKILYFKRCYINNSSNNNKSNKSKKKMLHNVQMILSISFCVKASIILLFFIYSVNICKSTYS